MSRISKLRDLDLMCGRFSLSVPVSLNDLHIRSIRLTVSTARANTTYGRLPRA